MISGSVAGALVLSAALLIIVILVVKKRRDASDDIPMQQLAAHFQNGADGYQNIDFQGY